MTTSEEDITRGHELYLRHLLLLGEAVPVALKAVIEREVNKRGRNLDSLLIEKKEIFNKYYNVEFLQLFQNDEVNANIDLWDTRMLCAVALVLFESDLDSTKLEAIACIQDQMKDLDNYAHSASLNYKTFETKWDPLHSALLELIKDIDDEVRFSCKRKIYCFKSESICVNFDLINNMKQTSDISLHVQMAIQNKIIAKTDGENGGTAAEKKDKIPLHYDNPVFTEMLQDTCVFLGESAILTCKLNVPEKAVTWQHEYKPVEETDTVIVVKRKCAHWLAISHAKLEDAGQYSCTCGNTSTAAVLNISEKPLKITECLHVATAEADVREHMDIVLSCEVNRHTNKAVWRHNGQVIKPYNRRVVSIDHLEHRLTIRNAKFEDEGDYTVYFGDVTSSIQLTINGNLSLSHKKQLTEELYRNWVRGALGLKYLKVGLERFCDTTVSKHHSEILTRLPTTANACTNCTEESLLPSHAKKNCPNKSKCLCLKKPHKRTTCPNGGFCSILHDQILDDHRFNDPLLKNTDIQTWSSDPWSVATCYINTPGYKGKPSAKDVDCAGLLSIFINNTFFHKSLGNVKIDGKTDLFKQARDARNDILHNANYELSEGQLHDCIDLFIKALEIRDHNGRCPLSGRDVQVAIKNLNELRDKQIDVHVSKDLQKEIRELKEHAMSELADNVQEAIKLSHSKAQQLEEKLKKTEEDLQLMRDLRSTQMKSKES
ncbi:uncharacterized protein LOC128552648, partial [Mercenaria mercenaria]|uniref:uncharacterized protein LOC128552648 n=1 Tax=Mercenaria mercenaria TaxID=6596 RepID=UPI00234F9E18